MFKKDLSLELTEDELRLVKKAIAFVILNDDKLQDEQLRLLRVLFHKILYE